MLTRVGERVSKAHRVVPRGQIETEGIVNNGTYILHAGDPNQVSSAAVIDFSVGNPGKRMLVLSGIAIPAADTNDEDDVGHPHVIVKLGVSVRSIESASALVGLASITNDDSNFVFAADTAKVFADSQSGELTLDINSGLCGDGTALNRIGYQVVCIASTLDSVISGEIAWTRNIRDTAQDGPATIDPFFRIEAGRMEPGPAPPGGFASARFVPVAMGRVVDVDSGSDGWAAKYEITNLPLGQPLVVQVTIGPGFSGSQFPIAAGRSGGPDPVVLTLSALQVDGVNFRIALVNPFGF
jgi:hypothetical protein